jgi:arylsulfatase
MDDTRHDEEPQRHHDAWRGLLGAGASRRAVVKAAASAALAASGASLATSAPSSARQDASPEPASPTAAPSAGERPNILAIMGDDIGYWNISAYNLGMMGYQTPNIDRIAQEGVQFTDAYGEQSCTAGRAAFITGQSPFRTGLMKVGMPAEKTGINAEDPTIAELLKPLGYVTGQFGKNHLGDRNEYLPTVHGFDEFFGSLYHLNAEEEPEHPDYPENPEFRERYGPRGVLHTWVTDEEDPTEDPRFGVVGRQRIEDTGPLTTERMETVDEEFLAASLDFIDRAHEADQPFFVWFNSTRMHVNTHLKPEAAGVTGLGVHADGMVEHDGMVGQLLQKLDDLGIAGDTIVIYMTDNGAEVFSWPDGGTTPFRGEKNTNWEGGFRIPMMARWPGHFAEGTISNELISLQDWLPTLLAAAGEPDITDKLLEGHTAGDKTFNVHIDGYNQLDRLAGSAPSPRGEFFYFSDFGDFLGFRYDRWKFVFMEQRAEGLDVWSEPFVELRRPLIFDIRGDPFERAHDESGNYDRWLFDHAFVGYPVADYLRQFASTFVDHPPRQLEAKIERIRLIMEQFEQMHPGD